MSKAKKFMELALLKIKSLRKFSNSNNVITANSQELGSRSHSLQSNSHGLCVFHVANVS